MNTIFTLALVSALKRKQVKEVLAELLVINGKEEEAQEVKDASRFTNALIDRTVASSLPQAEPETTEEDVTVEDEEETTNEADAPITVADIKALVESGKKKHIKAAKKAFKAQFSKEHPNYKELKKLIKEA